MMNGPNHKSVTERPTEYRLGRSEFDIPGDPPGFTFPAPGHNMIHTLLSGVTGSGKSSTAAQIMRWSSADPTNAFLGIDFKEGLELLPWEDRFTAIGTCVDSVGVILEDVCKEIPARAAVMKQIKKAEGRTVRNWSADLGPFIVLVVDEMSLLVVERELLKMTKQIAATARALGIFMLCSTQYALAKDFDSALLKNLPARICHRMDTLKSYATALGCEERDLKDEGFQAIPDTHERKGECVVRGVYGMPDFVRCKANFVDDEAIDYWVPKVAHLRVPAHQAFIHKRDEHG